MLEVLGEFPFAQQIANFDEDNDLFTLSSNHIKAPQWIHLYFI
jgi:hypothetical protein